MAINHFRFGGSSPRGKEDDPPAILLDDGWQWRALPEPRPLYGLDRLAENPSAPVVVVEGEKAADAASRIFPDSVCVTSPGGSNAAAKCDWTPLAKRQVMVWPDADKPGAGYRQSVTTILQDLDCEISVVEFDGKPEAWDAADAVAEWPDLAALRCEVLKHAKPYAKQEESSKSQNDARKAVLVKADTLKPESINWAWKNRFAFGKLAVIAGDPGLGKSTILIEIAALHSIGGEFPCGEGHAQQCETLILTAEDGLRDTCIPRLMAAGADLSKIHFLTGTKTEGEDGEAMFDLAKDIAALRAVFKAHPAIRVLIIDPLTAYLGETKAKENAAVRRVLMPLAKLIEDFNICVLANNHLNKGAGKALYRVLDSIAFVAVGRTVHLVIKDADNPDNRKFICDKTNIGSRPLGLTYIIQKTLGLR